MGTTLTGTTPQDTYDSLIKVTDNGPLSGTLKALSDGLGNDSSLSLSTAAASIAGTLAVTGNATFDTNTLFVNASTDRVGVGTTAPNTTLSVVTSGTQNTISPIVTAQTSTVTYGGLYAVRDGAGDQRGLVLQTYEANIGLVEKVRISSLGNVGIGSLAATGARLESFVSSAGAAPTVTLRLENTGANYQAKMVLTDGNTNDGIIVYQGSAAADGQYLGFGVGTSNDVQITASKYLRMASGTGGIQFNGDTAAANALDDYEEGTWTMGVSFGGAAVGMTFVNNEGRYTKIGRQVTAGGYMAFSNKGSSTGDATLTGLPFTSGAFAAGITPVTLRLENITFTNAFQGFLDTNRTSIDLGEVTILGVTSNLTNADFSNSSVLMVSITYTV